MKADLKKSEIIPSSEFSKSDNKLTSEGLVTKETSEILNLDKDRSLKVISKILTFLELDDNHNWDSSKYLNSSISAELSTLNEISSDKFLGIIGKCLIPGCDVHALDSDFKIIKHFNIQDSIDSSFEKAREVAKVIPEGVIGVLVFEKSLFYLHLNGELEVVYE